MTKCVICGATKDVDDCPMCDRDICLNCEDKCDRCMPPGYLPEHPDVAEVGAVRYVDGKIKIGD